MAALACVSISKELVVLSISLVSQLYAGPFLSCCPATAGKQSTVPCAALEQSPNQHQAHLFKVWWAVQLRRIHCVHMCAMLLQDYEAERLSQQDSAAVRQQERIHDDLTLGLSGTEATGLHHQGGSGVLQCLPSKSCLFAY